MGRTVAGKRLTSLEHGVQPAHEIRSDQAVEVLPSVHQRRLTQYRFHPSVNGSKLAGKFWSVHVASNETKHLLSAKQPQHLSYPHLQRFHLALTTTTTAKP